MVYVSILSTDKINFMAKGTHCLALISFFFHTPKIVIVVHLYLCCYMWIVMYYCWKGWSEPFRSGWKALRFEYRFGEVEEKIQWPSGPISLVVSFFTGLETVTNELFNQYYLHKVPDWRETFFSLYAKQIQLSITHGRKFTFHARNTVMRLNPVALKSTNKPISIIK